ncbi:MAG: hypothetical protein N2C14_01930 [Planctomycetales bacterium]
MRSYWILALLSAAAIGCGESADSPADATSSQTQATQTSGEPTRRKAESGMGKHSRNLEGTGPVGTILRARFTAEEKLIFGQIPRLVQFFRAQHNRLPESQEEFMEKIIKFNRIKLPELPPGSVYVYDPATGELEVEESGTAAAP